MNIDDLRSLDGSVIVHSPAPVVHETSPSERTVPGLPHEGDYFDLSEIGGRRSDFARDLATGADQIGDEPVVHVEDALVLGPIPHVVALRQHSPDLRPQTKRVRQHLKDDVPFRWPESVVPKRRQTECVSGAVGEIEPTVQGVRVVLGVLQPRQPRSDEACELLRIGRFLSRGRFPDPRDAQAAMGRSCSDPITQSFGCSSTRVTNAFSVRARFENSAAVYTVGSPSGPACA